MKVKISINQDTKKGFFSGTTHSYKVNANFTLNEKEMKIFNDHPLFQDMIFMSKRYGEKDYQVINYTAKDIFEGRPFEVTANGVNEVVSWRDEIASSAENFVGYINTLEGLIAERELTFGEG